MRKLNAKDRRDYRQHAASVAAGCDADGIFWMSPTRCPQCGGFLLAMRAEDDAVICSSCHIVRTAGDST